MTTLTKPEQRHFDALDRAIESTSWIVDGAELAEIHHLLRKMQAQIDGLRVQNEAMRDVILAVKEDDQDIFTEPVRGDYWRTARDKALAMVPASTPPQAPVTVEHSGFCASGGDWLDRSGTRPVWRPYPCNCKPTTQPQSPALLGDGADLIGRKVAVFGDEYVITGKNYCGDWDVERSEVREDGRYIIKTSVSGKVLPVDHPHFARLLDGAAANPPQPPPGVICKGD